MGDNVTNVNGAVPLRGPFGGTSFYKKFSSIVDGTSNTIAFSERVAHNAQNANGLIVTATGNEQANRFTANQPLILST